MLSVSIYVERSTRRADVVQTAVQQCRQWYIIYTL